MQLAILLTAIILAQCLVIIHSAKAPATTKAPPAKDLECYKCDSCASVDGKTPKVKCNVCETDPKTKKQNCVKGCATTIDAKGVSRRCQAVVEDPLAKTCGASLCNNANFTTKVKCFKCDNCLHVTANTSKVDCFNQCQKLTNTTTKRADYGCAKLNCPATLGGKSLQCCAKDHCNHFGTFKKLNVTTAAPKKNATAPTTAKPTQKAKATSYGNHVQPFTYPTLALFTIVVVKAIYLN